MLKIVSITAALLFASGVATAQTPCNPASSQCSDLLKVSVLGAPDFVLTMPEGAPGSVEPTGVYDAPPGTFGLVGPGTLPVGTGFIGGVALIEPLGTGIAAGTPILYNQFPVSDLVLSFRFTNPNGVNTFGVAFISDGSPDLVAWINFFNATPPAVFTLPTLVETGVYQDVTPFLGLPVPGPFRVAVLSDVEAIPEPQTYALFAAGLGLLHLVLRRKTRR